jgi:hypothetical protein
MKIKVRIALAVDCAAQWMAIGWNHGNPDDDTMMSNAEDAVDDGNSRYWIEAEVDVPEDKTVIGTVTEEKTP